jgi:hypothetical protein
MRGLLSGWRYRKAAFCLFGLASAKDAKAEGSIIVGGYIQEVEGPWDAAYVVTIVTENVNTGSGKMSVGVFDEDTVSWEFATNGNGKQVVSVGPNTYTVWHYYITPDSQWSYDIQSGVFPFASVIAGIEYADPELDPPTIGAADLTVQVWEIE